MKKKKCIGEFTGFGSVLRVYVHVCEFGFILCACMNELHHQGGQYMNVLLIK